MSQYKIIFTGPTGSGKSTAISSISDIPPLKTNDPASSGLPRPENTKAAITTDYGVMNLEGGEKIHLHGTSGQEHFDSMWDILANGGIGLILLLDNSRPDPFKDLWFFLDAFKGFIAQTGVAIGVTRMDISPRPTIEDYHWQMQLSQLKPPVFAVDARVKNDVSLLVQSLLYTLDPGVVE
jgi:uncharacterized protein